MKLLHTLAIAAIVALVPVRSMALIAEDAIEPTQQLQTASYFMTEQETDELANEVCQDLHQGALPKQLAQKTVREIANRSGNDKDAFDLNSQRFYVRFKSVCSSN
jgi:hypothetical protein